jgi:hypothetical protein
MEHDMTNWQDAEELWSTYYLVGSNGWSDRQGVLIVQPGGTAHAIPEAIRWAREWSKGQPEANIWGIYAGMTGHDKWMRWRFEDFRSAGAHSVYVKDGGHDWLPMVTLAQQPKRNGWPARMVRVAGPIDRRGHGEWVVPRMICKDPSIRYPRAYKSMMAIQAALETENTFLSAFRHGA